MIEIEHIARGPEATHAFAAELAACLVGGDVIALDGPLGAGKTCFVRGLAAGLGLDTSVVSSPTFVLCQHYDAAPPGIGVLHLDAYRLADPEELDTIGFDEMLERGDVVVAIEWAERLGERRPAGAIGVALSHVDEDTRCIHVRVSHAQAERLGLAEASS